ncbi:MAG: hypothetical protein ABDH20_02930 [Thermus sp.]
MRPRLWDRQFRIMRLEPDFVERVVREFLEAGVPLEPPKQPLAFCLNTPCTECAYLHFCDLKGEKEAWIKKYGEAKANQRKRQLEEEFRAEVGSLHVPLPDGGWDEGGGENPGAQAPKSPGAQEPGSPRPGAPEAPGNPRRR